MEQHTRHIVIAEDNEAVRQGLRDLLDAAGPFDSVRAFASAEALLEATANRRPDLAILDIGLPGMNGIECLVRLKAQCPGCRALMFTVMHDDDKVFTALQAGADGYLLKHEAPEKMIEAIHDAFDGGAPMSSDIARRVLLSFRKPAENRREIADVLSDREAQTLDLLAQGLLYKEIADQLDITISTVKQHVHRIYEKLQVQNRTEAVLRYLGKT